MVEVVVTDEFRDWFDSLSDKHAESVAHAVGVLEIKGVALGFPACSDIKGASFALRELRIKSHGHALRVLYAFDHRRNAVLILGGDKTGDDRFYERVKPQAERIWAEYINETT